MRVMMPYIPPVKVVINNIKINSRLFLLEHKSTITIFSNIVTFLDVGRIA